LSEDILAASEEIQSMKRGQRTINNNNN